MMMRTGTTLRGSDNFAAAARRHVGRPKLDVLSVDFNYTAWPRKQAVDTCRKHRCSGGKIQHAIFLLQLATKGRRRVVLRRKCERARRQQGKRAFQQGHTRGGEFRL